MRKIGIFGGAFNPPHIAHLILAQDVKEQLGLNKIIFIPAGNPPLKKNEVVDSRHRLNMAKLTFENKRGFEVCDIEMKKSLQTSPEKPGKSYTIDTIIKLRNIFDTNSVKLYLIIGIDNLIDFPKWKEPEKLFNFCDIVVMNRSEYNSSKVSKKYIKKIIMLNTPILGISSSMIRNYVKINKSIDFLVVPKVKKYIFSNNLYK